MKKSLLLILILAICLSLCIVFTACNKDEGVVFVGINSKQYPDSGIKTFVISSDKYGSSAGINSDGNFVSRYGNDVYAVIELKAGYLIGDLAFSFDGTLKTFSAIEEQPNKYFAYIGKIEKQNKKAKQIKIGFLGKTDQKSSRLSIDTTLLEKVENARYQISIEGIDGMDGETVYTHDEFVELLNSQAIKDALANYKQGRKIIAKAWLLNGTEMPNKVVPSFVALTNLSGSSSSDYTAESLEPETMKTVAKMLIGYDEARLAFILKAAEIDEFSPNKTLKSEFYLVDKFEEISDELITYNIDGVDYPAKNNTITLAKMVKASKITAKIKLTTFLSRCYEMRDEHNNHCFEYLNGDYYTYDMFGGTANNKSFSVKPTLRENYLTFDLLKPYEYTKSIFSINTYRFRANNVPYKIGNALEKLNGIGKITIGNEEGCSLKVDSSKGLYVNQIDEQGVSTKDLYFAKGVDLDFALSLFNTENGKTNVEINFGEKVYKCQVYKDVDDTYKMNELSGVDGVTCTLQAGVDSYDNLEVKVKVLLGSSFLDSISLVAMKAERVG